MPVFLDNASTTSMTPKTIDSINEAYKEYYNPSAIYQEGFNVKDKINQSKNNISNILHCNPYNLYFTSGGTEGDNWVIKGLINWAKANNKHTFITSAFEHHAIIRTLESLDDYFNIVYINPDSNGLIQVKDVKKEILKYQDDIILVSIMHVNNVIGTIQPIFEISNICHEYDILFHSDGTQAIGHIPINLTALDVDFYTTSAHKHHGPKGIGLMYIKDNTNITPLIHGGGQQNGLRSGTENYPLIKGLETSLIECYENLDKHCNHVYKLFNMTISFLHDNFTNYKINGDLNSRIYSNINISFKDINSDLLVSLIGNKGYLISKGSACDTGDLQDSYVLVSINQPKEYMEMIRITFNEYNSIEEYKEFLEALKETIKEWRGYL